MDSFPLILHDQTLDALSIYIKEDKWNIIIRDGQKTCPSFTIEGLVDSILLDAKHIAFELSCDMSDFSTLTSLLANGSEVMLIVADSSISSLIRLTAEDRIILNISSAANANMILHLCGVVQAAQINVDTAQMLVVRLCVISDWTDGYIADMEDLTMQSMIYTEVV